MALQGPNATITWFFISHALDRKQKNYLSMKKWTRWGWVRRKPSCDSHQTFPGWGLGRAWAHHAPPGLAEPGKQVHRVQTQQGGTLSHLTHTQHCEYSILPMKLKPGLSCWCRTGQLLENTNYMYFLKYSKHLILCSTVFIYADDHKPLPFSGGL